MKLRGASVQKKMSFILDMLNIYIGNSTGKRLNYVSDQ